MTHTHTRLLTALLLAFMAAGLVTVTRPLQEMVR